MNYKDYLLSNERPPMPGLLPNLVKTLISKVPEYMRPAAANDIFPPIAAQIHDVTFRYIDNVVHEPSVCGMQGTVAESGVGKGYLDALNESLIRYLREHDEESYRKLQEYQRLYKKKGKDKDKPERPMDAAILVPEPDMTNPALVQLLMDAEREGNRSLYCVLTEIDLLDQCCGSHKKVTKLIRLNFDTKKYGAMRATPDGITGNPTLRWKFNFSTTVKKAQMFFRDCLIDGTLGRINITYIPRPNNRHRGEIPRQGNYDENFLTEVDEFLIRFRSATGEIHVPKIDKLVTRLAKELGEIADLSDDDTFQSFANRALVIGWMKGCLLYISEGYHWTKRIEDFVEWSIYDDLWSKIAIFAPQLKKASATEYIDVRKYGPANMIDMLPTPSFSRQQLEQLRSSMDKSPYCKSQLDNWISRGYITYSEETKLYTKTESYLQKHPS